MHWPKYYLAAIALHLAVLCGFVLTVAQPVSPQKEYVIVTLDEARPPQPVSTDPAPVANVVSLRSPMEASAAVQEALAPVLTPETPTAVNDSFTQQAADHAGPATPGAMEGAEGGGSIDRTPGVLGKFDGHTYELVSAPNGINWYEADASASARGGYLAIFIGGPKGSPQLSFLLKFMRLKVTDPIYWRLDSEVPYLVYAGPWIGDDSADGSDGSWLLGMHGIFNGRPWYNSAEFIQSHGLRFDHAPIGDGINPYPRTRLGPSYLIEYDGDPPAL